MYPVFDGAQRLSSMHVPHLGHNIDHVVSALSGGLASRTGVKFLEDWDFVPGIGQCR